MNAQFFSNEIGYNFNQRKAQVRKSRQISILWPALGTSR